MSHRRSRGAGENHRSAFRRECAERSAGFGLIELIVALMILSIGLLALTGAVAVAQRSLTAAQALEEGVDAAAFVLDSLMREAAPMAGDRRDGRTHVRWSVRDDSIADVIHLTVTVRDGARERHLTFRATHRTR